MLFKIERNEIKSFEIAQEKDYMLISYILASSVPNSNGALFTKEELERAENTIIDQPLIIVPDWNNLPTGHSISNFPKLDYDAYVIGTHVGADIIEEDGVYHLKTQAKIWKIRYPEIAETLYKLHEIGELKFSMECSFKKQTVEGTVRTLHDVSFVGSAVVSNPANENSYSLEVATKNDIGGKFSMTLEEAIKKIGELEGTVASLETANAQLKTDKESLESNKKELASTLETANAKIDEVTGELETIKAEVAQKEKNELAAKRFDEMAQFVDYTDAEKEQKMLAFASMDEDTFGIVLETAKRNPKAEQKPSGFSLASDTRMNFQKGFLDGLE